MDTNKSSIMCFLQVIVQQWMQILSAYHLCQINCLFWVIDHLLPFLFLWEILSGMSNVLDFHALSLLLSGRVSFWPRYGIVKICLMVLRGFVFYVIYAFGSWEKQDSFEFHAAKPSIKYRGPYVPLQKMASTFKCSSVPYPRYHKFNLSLGHFHLGGDSHFFLRGIYKNVKEKLIVFPWPRLPIFSISRLFLLLF